MINDRFDRNYYDDFNYIIAFFKQLFLFYYRTDDMVDVISTRLQEAYGAWRLPGYATSGNPNNNILDERFSATALRRFGDENRRRKTFNKEIERQVSYTVNVCLNDAFNLLYCSFFIQEQDRLLFEIKETASPDVMIQTKPVPGLSCRHCAPTNSVSMLQLIWQ